MRPRDRSGVLAAMLLVCGAAIAGAQVGPPDFETYANDELFSGVLTPRDLPDQGKFDTIYVLGNGLKPVSDAAPGDRHYNGGRWEVRPVTWLTLAPQQFTNAAQVQAAAAAGQIRIGDVVRRFECPLIPRRGQN
jgi:hypothetical protein